MQSDKTYTPKAKELKATWYLVDARGQTLGRLAANVARVLRGKHKAGYTPHINTGDHVIVVNASSIKVTGKKEEGKVYTSYTGYPGGLRKRTYGEALSKKPTFPFEHAVSGMLQHGTLGKQQLRRLKVYSGDQHPHSAQQPQPIKFGEKGEIKPVGR